METNNLVGVDAYAGIAAELDACVLENMRATGDDWDLQMDFPPPDFMTHAEANEHLLNVVKPAAIEIP